MNNQLIVQGLIEIILSLVTGLIIFFTSFKVFTFLTKDIDELAELKKSNSAIGILISAFVLGIMLLVKAVISPAMDSLSNVISGNNITASIISVVIIKILILYFIAAIFSFIMLWLAIKFFMILTKNIDEMNEVKNNNSAIAIVLATLIISLVVILIQPLTTMLQSFTIAPSLNVQTKEPFINMAVLSEGFIQLGISLIAAIFIFLLSFKVFSLLTKNIDEEKELKSNNIAIAVLVSGFIFAMMLLIKAAIEPAYDTLGLALASSSATTTTILLAVGRIIIMFLAAAIIAFIVLWLAMKAFMLLTVALDEMEQIKNKNIAVALIIAILLISSALLLQHGLQLLLSGLIPTPKIGKGLLDLSNLK